MVLCQASGVREIPQLIADVLHGCSWWYFVSVEDKCYAATAVIQMPAVWLALGGGFWRRGSGHGTNPPLMARGREAGEVAVLQTLSPSRAGLPSLVLVGGLKPAGTAPTQHLRAVHFPVGAVAAVALLFPAAAVGKLQASIVTAPPNTYKLLASGSRSTKWTDAAETVDLVHTGGAVGTG